MDMDVNDVHSVLRSYLSGEDSDEEQVGEELAPEEGVNSEWKPIKARLQTAGRSRHQIQPTEHKDMPELLRQWSLTFGNSKKRTFASRLKEQYAEWHSLLINEFHLAFYGVGSMKAQLEHFVFEELSPKHPVVIVNGFSPMVSLNSLVRTICRNVIQGYYGVAEFPKSLESQLLFLKKFFALKEKSMILVIHSVDELMRLHQDIWTTICEKIAAAPANVRLVISVDHHFAPTGISSSSMPFLWYPCLTGTPYDQELAFKRHLSAKNPNNAPKMNETEALQILASFPERVILIFCIYANLAHRGDVKPQDVPFDLILEKVQLAENIDFKTLETQLNHLQSFKLLQRDLKLQTVTTRLAPETLQKILDAHSEVWILYAADLL